MTTNKLICGVDPGLNGAFSFLNLNDNTVRIVDMPTFERNGKRHVDPVKVGAILTKHKPDSMIMEFVHASPQMGVSSSFSFGRSSGVILGAAGACGIAVTEVAPSVWKPKMSCTSDKKQTVARATQLLPKCATAWKLVKHTDRAEATLLALYGLIIANNTVKNEWTLAT